MSWRLARSLDTLRNQVNAAYPNRSKVSDGTIGDAAHAASASDHNPNRNGVVCALDLTHDPARGFDAHALAEHLRKNRHPNLRYVISNARIAGAHTGWQWQPSVGHYQHCHISVGTHGVGDGQTYDNYDSTQAWNIGIKKGGNDVFENSQRHYDIVAQTFEDSTGRKARTGKKLTRAEYNNNFVGKTAEALTIIHRSPEKAQWYKDAVMGRKARADNWQGQIHSLQAQVKALGGRPTQAQVDDLNKQLTLLSAQMKDAQAEATQARKDAVESAKALETIEGETAQAKKEANNFLTALINAIRKLFGGK